MHDESSPASPRTITAYAKGPDDGWLIEPAPSTRQWMDETQQRFAYKCLPLVMANQAGWVVRIPAAVRATWGGGQDMGDLKIQFQGAPDHFRKQVQATFGHAILSFVIPWIFRTPPGIGLWVRGVPNRTIPGAAALEGIVETDWATQPFTMNWRLLTPGRPIVFPKGEPICMLTPYPLDLPGQLEPHRRHITENPRLAEELHRFLESRTAQHRQSMRQISAGKTTYERDYWKLDYMKGRSSTGQKAREHRTNLKLKDFD